MLVGDDTEASLTAAVALVNSEREAGGLRTVEDLTDFFATHGYTGAHRGDEAELECVLALIPRLRALLLSGREAAVEIVNEILGEVGALPRLVRHGSTDWHIHALPDDADLHLRILAETAMAMVDLIRSDEMTRLAVCAADDCQGVVLDLSRNRSRRFCSTRCGNRAAVAAYRARGSGTGTS